MLIANHTQKITTVVITKAHPLGLRRHILQWVQLVSWNTNDCFHETVLSKVITIVTTNVTKYINIFVRLFIK